MEFKNKEVCLSSTRTVFINFATCNVLASTNRNLHVPSRDRGGPACCLQDGHCSSRQEHSYLHACQRSSSAFAALSVCAALKRASSAGGWACAGRAVGAIEEEVVNTLRVHYKLIVELCVGHVNHSKTTRLRRI
jgi:hypothetical protein